MGAFAKADGNKVGMVIDHDGTGNNVDVKSGIEMPLATNNNNNNSHSASEKIIDFANDDASNAAMVGTMTVKTKLLPQPQHNATSKESQPFDFNTTRHRVRTPASLPPTTTSHRSDRWGGSPLDDAHCHCHTEVANF